MNNDDFSQQDAQPEQDDASTQTAPVSVHFTDSEPDFTNDEPIVVNDASYVLKGYSTGSTGANEEEKKVTAAHGGSTLNSANLSNNGNLTLNGATSNAVSTTIVELILQGGNGGNQINDDGKGNGGSGGNGGSVSVHNSGNIIVNKSSGASGNYFPYGLYLINASTCGGLGGSSQSDNGVEYSDDGSYQSDLRFDGGLGGQGGTAGAPSVRILGSYIGAGTTDLPLKVEGEFIGVQAKSNGGKAGLGEQGTEGQPGGSSNISTSYSCNVELYADNTSALSSFYGILSKSVGADGTPSYANHQDSSNTTLNNGGDGGSSYNALVRLDESDYDNKYANVIVLEGIVNDDAIITKSTVPLGAGIGAIGQAGSGGTGYYGDSDDPSKAGDGGGAGQAAVIVNALTTIEVTGDALFGIYAHSLGGAGGEGYTPANDNIYSDAGDGGTGYVARVDVGCDIFPVAINSVGANGGGVFAHAVSGDGGDAHLHTPDFTGHAGDGGQGAGFSGLSAQVQMGLASYTSITTDGLNSPGIVALTELGKGGDGGELSTNLDSVDGPGNGGDAGNGSTASVYLSATEDDVIGAGSMKTLIETSGDSSPGVVVKSIGSNGGAGGKLKCELTGNAGNGGDGGSSGNIEVIAGQYSTISTAGDNSIGIISSMISGVGGLGGERSTGSGNAGIGGAGGDTGTHQISFAGEITTAGTSSIGILASSVSGTGGEGGDSSWVIYQNAGNGGASGELETMTIVNKGVIITSGDSSHGLNIQSLAGGAGSGGSNTIGGVVSEGGTPGASSNGGEIDYSSDGGSISTEGQNAVGIILQSIGGGGGDGGDSEGVIALGGDGGAGGNGGILSFSRAGEGLINTTGRLSNAIIAQSIGGGGGSGGDASIDTVGTALEIGGAGGDGGAGGNVSISNAGDIKTESYKAVGILSQSIGGGGGSGGSAYCFTVSEAISAAVAIGGSGGAGGDGKKVSLNHDFGEIFTGYFETPSEPTNLLPIDAIGLLAQSIGGGGGNGGSAFASAVALNAVVPTTDVQVGASVALSLGGNGGCAGNGEDVNINLGTLESSSSNASIITQGQGSHGILAQSIGGGGGNGADSSATSTTITSSRAADQAEQATIGVDVSISAGGQGGSAGNGSSVVVTVGADDAETTEVTTYGDFSNGIVSQSIGGGGGNAGFGSSSTQSFGNTTEVGVTATVGSQGGGGGSGFAVNTNIVNGSVTTFGDGAYGYVLQSIGGGGGLSQGGTLCLAASTSTDVGGDSSEEETEPTTLSLSGTVNLSVGAQGGYGGSGGEVSMTLGGATVTNGNDAIGIALQSIGGGGGVVGSSGASASADNPAMPVLQGVRAFEDYVLDGGESGDETSFSADATVNLGNNINGVSGNGNSIAVSQTTNTSNTIETLGAWSHGILAQSIGGGGGIGGSAVSQALSTTMALSQNLGGRSNEVLGNGGNVNIVLGNGEITTRGYAAYGMIFQSIGGGGGVASDGSNSAQGSVNIGPSGNVGISGNTGVLAGDITVSSSGSGVTHTIVTSGDTAHGVLLQSIAGGGGIGGAGNNNFNPDQSDIAVNVGATGNEYMTVNAGSIALDSMPVAVNTQGDHAYGILAQSIGGGGGLASVLNPSSSVVGTFDTNVANADGNSIDLTFVQGSSLQTSGANSHAIIAQSIGGGGGIGGYSTINDSFLVDPSSFATANTSAKGKGGEIQIRLSADSQVETTGDRSFAILAQSIAGAGGIIPNADGKIYFGGTSSQCLEGSGSNVNIQVQGSVSVSGADAVGVFAQSVTASTTESNGIISITVAGSIDASAADGIAIWVDGGKIGNVVTINDGGSVSGGIKYTGTSGLALNNYGVFNGELLGAVNESSSKVSVVNKPQAEFVAESLIEANVINEGVFKIGGEIEQGTSSTTLLNGDYVQREHGEIILDMMNKEDFSEILTIKGNAKLAGKLRIINYQAKEELKIPVIKVKGEIAGSIALAGLVDADDSKFIHELEITETTIHLCCKKRKN